MHSLVRTLPESELREWLSFARRRMLPSRRLELYLARICLLIAQTMGGNKDAVLKEFLFDPPEPEPPRTHVAEVVVAREFFGFAPRKKAKQDDAV